MQSVLRRRTTASLAPNLAVANNTRLKCEAQARSRQTGFENLEQILKRIRGEPHLTSTQHSQPTIHQLRRSSLTSNSSVGDGNDSRVSLRPLPSPTKKEPNDITNCMLNHALTAATASISPPVVADVRSTSSCSSLVSLSLSPSPMSSATTPPPKSAFYHTRKHQKQQEKQHEVVTSFKFKFNHSYGDESKLNH